MYELQHPRLEWRAAGLRYFASPASKAAVERAKRQGFERICAMRDKGGYRYYYCESKAMPGVWIELLESYPALHDIFEQGIAAAANWDGRDPIRNFEYSEL